MPTKLDLRAIQLDGQLEPSLLEAFAQAAEVCFERRHTSPASLCVSSPDRSDDERWFEVRWGAISERQKNSHKNVLDAVEFGAYGVALSVLRETHDLGAYSRADQETGADFYVIPQGDDDFERAMRLEISGSETDAVRIINARLHEKVEQLANGKSDLPGLACVVGFTLKSVKIQAVP